LKKGSNQTIILIIFFTLCFYNSFGQNYKLLVYGKDSIETKIISKIHYKSNHQTKNNAFSEIDSITRKLNQLGFINNTYNATIYADTVNCKYRLGEKIDTVLISFKKNEISKDLLQKLSIKHNLNNFKIKFTELEKTLNAIVSYFEKNGYPFTMVNLKNTTQNKNVLSAELVVLKNEKRKIDKIVLKGYNNFPEKFKKHYLNFTKNKTFNTDLIIEVENKVNNLPFIQQVKKPEILFAKDSTLLYIYLKKRSQNNFDGIIGFSNENNGKLKITGYLNLHLENIFDKGETFNLIWKNSKDLNNQLKISSITPYIFNSKSSFETNFSIFKQDSTFLNTNADAYLSYPINTKNSIQFLYQFENSSVIKETNSSLEDFSKNLFGISYRFSSPLKTNSKHHIKFDTGILYGNKKTKNTENESKLFFNGSYTYNLNEKSLISLKNRFYKIDNSTLSQNEMLRIGGINSIRGFNDESIFTPEYNLTQLEYHLNLASNFNVFTITDFALYKNPNTTKQDKIYSFGLGSNFNIQSNSVLSIIYAVGKPNNTSINLKNSKFHIKISYSI
jgi:hypothetical protein